MYCSLCMYVRTYVCMSEHMYEIAVGHLTFPSIFVQIPLGANHMYIGLTLVLTLIVTIL